MTRKRCERVPLALRLLLAAGLGVLGGLAWYRFVGCRSGGCPLTSNPWLMSLFGAAMGLSLAWPDRKTNPPSHEGPGEGDRRDGVV